MNKRQRKRKKRLIHEGDLAPGVAAGLTQDASLEEAFQEAERQRPLQSVDGIDIVKHMRDADKRLERSGDGFASFVVSNDVGAVWTDGVTDRLQYDLHKTYTEQGMRYLREGRQCLRCDEPLDPPMPVACPLCGYSVAERQIMDIAMEFEGLKHLGPSQPISEYMQEQELRVEKRKFEKKIAEGGSRGRLAS